MRGSRNRLSEALTCALLRDFSKHGEKAIAKVRRTHPAAYLKICALLVSREMKVERSGGVKDMTDEQLEQAIATLQAMIDARSCRSPLLILSYPSGYPRAVVTWIRQVQENP
jgi:hypothetical protein